MFADYLFDILIVLLAIKLRWLSSWEMSWSWKAGFEVKRKSCRVPSPLSAPASTVSPAALLASSAASGAGPCMGGPFSALRDLSPEQLVAFLSELDPYVLEPHMQQLGELLLWRSKQLALTDVSRLFLAVAELITKEGSPSTRQLALRKHSASLWLLPVLKDMAEQAKQQLHGEVCLHVVANLAHACALVLPRQIRQNVLYTPFRQLLLSLLSYMGIEPDRVRTYTAQDVRRISRAYEHFNLMNKSYSKKFQRMLTVLAERLGDGGIVASATSHP